MRNGRPGKEDGMAKKTNREWLAEKDDYELGRTLCTFFIDCNYCRLKGSCNGWKMDGFEKWLGEERKEETDD